MWLFGRNIDLLALFIPVWSIWLLLFLLPPQTLHAEVPLWVWVTGVLMIDVAHVWSTIFRTYFDKEERSQHRQLLGFAPIICFIVLFTIASESVAWFWRIMAYIALFHFIKQQYGFFALYSAKSGAMKVRKQINDKFVIYFSMLYPMVFWHLNTRSFSWFVTGDFFQFQLEVNILWPVLHCCYWLLILSWIIEEIVLIRTQKMSFSTGRVLWLITTALNWYLGIVYFNSDLAFTITNVVAHGVPYITLIVFYQLSKNTSFSSHKMLIMAMTIIFGSVIFAFSEEYLWDLLVNQDKQLLFGSLMEYPTLMSPRIQAAALALLSLPQVVHYVLDGFIWKMNKRNPHLKNMLKSDG